METLSQLLLLLLLGPFDYFAFRIVTRTVMMYDRAGRRWSESRRQAARGRGTLMEVREGRSLMDSRNKSVNEFFFSLEIRSLRIYN